MKLLICSYEMYEAHLETSTQNEQESITLPLLTSLEYLQYLSVSQNNSQIPFRMLKCCFFLLKTE